MSKVLVTGGSGFIGGHIVQELERRGHSVTIVDVRSPTYFTNARVVVHDVHDLPRTGVLKPNEFDVIFHAAGSLGSHTTFDRVYETFNTNVMGMVSLMEWIKSSSKQPVNDYEQESYNKGVPKVINCGLIRDWLNPYMISKHTASKIGQMYRDTFGVPFIDVRMTVVFGSRQGWKEEKVVPRFIIKSLMDDMLPVFGDGSSLMNFMYVKDAASILVGLAGIDELFSVRSPVVLDLANPSGDISVKEFADMVIELSGSKSAIEYLPMRRGQPGQVKNVYNLESIKKYVYNLDNVFTSIESGMLDTINYYKGCL